jgi:CheY-specific phosphatase CheX
MSEKFEKELYNASLKVFKQMGFSVKPAQSDDVCSNGALVEFWGPCQGKLIVKMSDSSMDELAIIMLGDDYHGDRHDEEGALKELANILCGHVFPFITDSKDSFTIGSPSLYPALDNHNEDPGQRLARVTLQTAKGNVDIELRVVQ